MRRRPGFTLIELLVVVSIIALLIAILLPALSSARRSARLAVCLTQMHSFSIAWNNYAVDNDGVSVYTNNGSNTNGWLYAIRNPSDPTRWTGLGSASNAQERAALRETGYLFDYFNGESSTYHCPEDDGPFDQPRAAARDLTSYLFNSSLGTYTVSATGAKFHGYPIERIRSDAIFLWEADESRVGGTYDNGMWNDGANRPDEGISQRHIKGAPVIAIDGSAWEMSFDDFYTMAGGTWAKTLGYNQGGVKPSQLWCKP